MEPGKLGERCIPKRDQMVAIIGRYVGRVSRTEEVPFAESLAYVAAEDVLAVNTLPNLPVSRFDGIGVRYADFEGGGPDTSAWTEGREYVYCNTGIAIPDGYDTVIAIEDVVIGKAGIEVHELPAFKGEMVNPVGGQMREGERLIAEGEVILPAHMGLFAAGGIDFVRVYSKPRIGIIPTGDELVPPGGPLPLGKNVDSNTSMIAAYLSQWGAQPVPYPIARDNEGELIQAIQRALQENDAFVIIAGSSLGTKDYTLKVLGEMGQVIVPELAHGPGRKSSFSLLEGKPVLGIAGPPLGAQITCDLYLAPFVSALRGLPHQELRQLEVISDDVYSPRPVDFCERAHIYQAEDGYHIRSAFAPKTTRAQMQALSQGNFYRPAGSSCQPGDPVRVELLCPIESISKGDRLLEVLGGVVEAYE